jgi:hypothetical protein
MTFGSGKPCLKKSHEDDSCGHNNLQHSRNTDSDPFNSALPAESYALGAPACA